MRSSEILVEEIHIPTNYNDKNVCVFNAFDLPFKFALCM